METDIIDNTENLITNETMINQTNDNPANLVDARNKKHSKVIYQHFVEYLLILSFILSITPTSFKATPMSLKIRVYNKIEKMTLMSIRDMFTIPTKASIYSLEEEMAEYEIEEYNEEPSYIDLYCEKLYSFLIKEKLTLEQFSEMIQLMTSDDLPLGFTYETKLDAFLDICFRDERSYPEKMLITMVRDGLSYDELDTVCAGCVSESIADGTCYEECYAVASTLINRTHAEWCIETYGTRIYEQFIAPSQYSVYPTKQYMDYLGCLDLSGYQAAVDVFYTREPSHDYLQFRAPFKTVKANYETFVAGGNKYFDKIQDSEYVPYEEFVLEDEESMRLLLETTINNLINGDLIFEDEHPTSLKLETPTNNYISLE